MDKVQERAKNLRCVEGPEATTPTTAVEVRVEEALVHAVRVHDLDGRTGRRDWVNLQRTKERTQAVSQRLPMTVLQMASMWCRDVSASSSRKHQRLGAPVPVEPYLPELVELILPPQSPGGRPCSG
jgi:hypothetical protein